MPPVAHAAAAGVPARRPPRAAAATAARAEDDAAAPRRRGGVGQQPAPEKTGGPLAVPGTTTPVPLPAQYAPSCPLGGAAALAEGVELSDTVDASVHHTKTHNPPRETSAPGVPHSVQGAQPNGADLPRGLLSAGLSFDRARTPASTSRALDPARAVSAAETLLPRGVDAHTLPNVAAAASPAGGTTAAAAGRFLGHDQPVLVPPPQKGAGLASADETGMECHSTKQEPEHPVSFWVPFAKVRVNPEPNQLTRSITPDTQPATACTHSRKHLIHDRLWLDVLQSNVCGNIPRLLRHVSCCC